MAELTNPATQATPATVSEYRDIPPSLENCTPAELAEYEEWQRERAAQTAQTVSGADAAGEMRAVGTLAMMDADTLEQIADWLTTANGSAHMPTNTYALAHWAQRNGPRLIATARAYHRLRELAGELVSAAERVRNYGETLSYECFECGGEHEYWGIDIGDSHSLGWAEQQLAAFLKHPACDPTDAGSGSVAAEGQDA